jgi:midasin (ATPase involved in ribosome maturation)
MGLSLRQFDSANRCFWRILIYRARRLQVYLLLYYTLKPKNKFSERLNSLFETTPSFSISEDITLDAGSDPSIAISSSFQVFASIHAEPGQSINISPATRSRFTIIHVPAYSQDELSSLLLNFLAKSSKLTSQGQLASTLIDLIFSVRECLRKDTGKFPNDVHSLFRLVEFIRDQLEFVSDQKFLIAKASLITFSGIRAFIYTDMSSSDQMKQMSLWWNSQEVRAKKLQNELLPILNAYKQQQGVFK